MTMSKEKIELMVEGGKATAAPPLGPALGPLKLNIGEVVGAINDKTRAFAGMKVPVKLVVDTETKSYDITVGTPPVSQLIKKEIGVDTGAGAPHEQKVGNVAVEQVIKIAMMKTDSMLVNSLKSAVKSVIGSCHSMGVLVESKPAKEVEAEIDQGKYDDLIKREVTVVPPEKSQALKAYLAKEQESYSSLVAKRKAEAEAIAAAKEAAAAAAAAAGVVPAAGAAPAAEGAKPAAGAEAKKEEAPKKEAKK